MNKIVSCLWFDNQGEEAARFYTSIFKNSKIGSITHYDEAGSTASGQPKGSVMTVSFQLNDYDFLALNGGPIFKLNPSVSFILNFDPSKDKNARKNLDTTWEKLSGEGTVLMPLDKYPFSERYGWIQDKYGVSWQLILTNPDDEERPFIVPSLLFVDDVSGRAEEAIRFYLSVFGNSKEGITVRYSKGMEPDKEGTIMYADFMIENTWFAAMDSAREHNFSFNEAGSFIVNCESQEEVDKYWNKLTDGGQESVCGWLKDKFGLSWQVTPTALPKMLADKDPEKAKRVMQAMLQMKKIDLRVLEEAYEGEKVHH